MRRVVSIWGIALFLILCNWCLTVWAGYSDAEKAYDSGDYTFAFNEYMPFAESGDTRSQVNIGWMYYYGEGIRQDKAQAMIWYRRAADDGDLTSMFNLAYEYEHGDGVKRSLYESGKWYGKITEQSNVLERLNLERLTKNIIIPGARQARLSRLWKELRRTLPSKNTQETIITYAAAPIAEVARLSAESQKDDHEDDVSKSQKKNIYPQPSADAAGVPLTGPQEQLETTHTGTAMNMDGGTIIPSANPGGEKFQNPHMEETHRAAEAGDRSAQIALGWIYSSGKGVPVDKAKAVRWYLLAAEKGDLNAQIALGWIYFDGKGYERNLNEAALWYGRAAAQGNAKAGQMLKKIKLICAESGSAVAAESGCHANRPAN